MFIAHVTLKIRQDKTDLYESTFDKLRRDVKEFEPGCSMFELCKDPAEFGVYHVFEAYLDDEATRYHTSTTYYQETANIFIECIAGNHLDEIKAKSLRGRAMYDAVKNIQIDRYETV